MVVNKHGGILNSLRFENNEKVEILVALVCRYVFNSLRRTVSCVVSGLGGELISGCIDGDVAFCCRFNFANLLISFLFFFTRP